MHIQLADLQQVCQEYTMGTGQFFQQMMLGKLILYFCCCCCSVTKLCLSLCDSVDCSMPGFPVLHCLPEFAQTHVYWVNNATWPSHPLLPLLLLPSFFPRVRLFSNESALLIRWPKNWSFCFSISPFAYQYAKWNRAPILHHTQKINSKWTKDLNVRPETINS